MENHNIQRQHKGERKMMYTLSKEWMEPKAEIRIGERIYKVDDRTSTVKKVMTLTRENNQNTEEQMDSVLRLVLGEQAYEEIAALDLPFGGYLQLFEMAVEAITGGKEENQRFHTKPDVV